MIKQVLEILNQDPFYNCSEAIDIAKGKNKIPTTLKEGWEVIKRNRKR